LALPGGRGAPVQCEASRCMSPGRT
jgi:hypothetical protein